MRELWNDPEYRARAVASRVEAAKRRDYGLGAEKIKASWTAEKRQEQSRKLKEAHVRMPERWEHSRKMNGDRMKARWAENYEEMHRLTVGARKITP